MNGREYVRLGLRILDEQIVDSEGRRCGRVEDLEFDARPGAPARVVALLSGATAWKRRLPRRIGDLIPGDPRGLVRIPWDVVGEVKNEILLSRPEAELEPAVGAEPAALAMSEVLGYEIVDRQGIELGRVHDVVASRPAGSDETTLWEVDGLLLGFTALLQRAGFSPMLDEEMGRGQFPKNLLPWREVAIAQE